MTVQRSRHGERGAAAVEFALVLPILVMLIFGIIDFGRMLAAKITLTEAAREGARATALVGREAAEDRIGVATSDLGVPIETSVIEECTGTNDDATVVLTFRFTFITPLALLVGAGDEDGQVDLRAKGVMPCLR
jgi:Flp pilus assembly protein TadG